MMLRFAFGFYFCWGREKNAAAVAADYFIFVLKRDRAIMWREIFGLGVKETRMKIEFGFCLKLRKRIGSFYCNIVWSKK